MKRTVFYVIIAIVVAIALYFGARAIITKNSSSSGTAQTDYIDLGDKDTELTYKPVDATKMDLGLKAYPGATVQSGDNFTGEVNFNGDKVSVITYSSQDSLDKIVAFYKTEFGSSAQVKKIQYDNSDIYVIKGSDENAAIAEIYKEDSLIYIKIIKK